MVRSDVKFFTAGSKDYRRTLAPSRENGAGHRGDGAESFYCFFCYILIQLKTMINTNLKKYWLLTCTAAALLLIAMVVVSRGAALTVNTSRPPTIKGTSASDIPLPFSPPRLKSSLVGSVVTSGTAGALQVVEINFSDGADQKLNPDTIYLVHTPAGIDTIPLDLALGANVDYFGYEYSDANATAEVANRDAPTLTQRFPSGKFFASAKARAEDASQGNGIAVFEKSQGMQFRGTDASPSSVRLEPQALYALVVDEQSGASINLYPAVVCGDGWKMGAEECDDRAKNGTDASNCTMDCKIKTPVPFGGTVGTSSSVTGTGGSMNVCNRDQWELLANGDGIQEVSDPPALKVTEFQGRLRAGLNSPQHQSVVIAVAGNELNWTDHHMFSYQDIDHETILGLIVYNQKLWTILKETKGDSFTGYTVTSKIFSSSDGIQWQEESSLGQYEPGGIIASGGKLWFIGGINYSNQATIDNGVTIYNLQALATDSVQYSTDGKVWTQGPSMPKPLVKFGVATLNGRIYIVGGGPFVGMAKFVGEPTNDVYSTDGNAWRSEPQAPIPVISPLIADGPHTIIYILRGEAWSFDGQTWSDKGRVVQPATHAPAGATITPEEQNANKLNDTVDGDHAVLTRANSDRLLLLVLADGSIFSYGCESSNPL